MKQSGNSVRFIFACLIVFLTIQSSVSAEEGPTFSIRTVSRTATLDPAAGMPWREHRGADLLDPSGLGDEPHFGDPGPGPDVQVEAEDVLLLPIQDAHAAEVDAISSSYNFPTEHFYLAFSVDWIVSVGAGGAALFNVKQQWDMNHPEGDIFYALPEMKIGHAAPVPANMHIDPAGVGNTHSLSPLYPSNQTEFDLGPRAAADQAWMDEDLYDDLDAFDFHTFTNSMIPFPCKPLYLSVDMHTALNIPDLPAVTGGDILVCETAGIFMWAQFWDLGLMTGDDIDALIVFGDQNLQYDSTDVVLFSLHPNSPTLTAHGFSAADVLVAHWQDNPTLFASAADLGLLPEDDLDALAPVFEEEPFQVFISTSVSHTGVPLPVVPLVVRNHPNPFNPVTTISFTIAPAEKSSLPVRLEIYDSAGRWVRTLVDERLPAGPHTCMWDGRSASGIPVGSGMFHCRLQAGNKTATSKLILVR